MDFKVFKVLYVCVVNMVSLATCIETIYMDERCGGVVVLSLYDQVRIQTTRFGYYPADLSCYMQIQAEFGSNMMVFFIELNMEGYSGGVCKNDYFILYDGPTSGSPTLGDRDRYCNGSTPSHILTSMGDTLYLKFHSDYSREGRGFDIVVTEYHTGACRVWEHTCDNKRCIDNSLTCNSYNPCGDHSGCKTDTAVIVGSFIGPLCFIFVVIAGILICKQRRRRLPRDSSRTPTVATTTSSANVNTISSHQSAYTQQTYNDPPPSYESLDFAYTNSVSPQYPPCPGGSPVSPPPAYPGLEMTNPASVN